MTETAQQLKYDADDESSPVEISTKAMAEARRWLREFHRNEGLDKTALSRRLGLGKHGRDIVAKFLAEKPLDKEINFEKVWRATEKLRVLVDSPDGKASFLFHVETRTIRVIHNHLAHVRNNRLLGAIVGPYGAGKSYALRKAQEMAARDGRPPIRIIRCRTTMNLSSLVSKVAINMGLIDREGTKISALHEDIVRRLAEYPEFLIFDEVDHLTHDRRCIDFIRDLHDEIGRGVLLCGQMYFLSWVWDKAQMRSARGEEGSKIAISGPLAPFADRLSCEIAPGLDDAEIVDTCENVMGAELTEEASKLITTYVQHSFRELCEILRVMRERAPRGAKSIEAKLVKEAWARCKHIKAKQ